MVQAATLDAPYDHSKNRIKAGSKAIIRVFSLKTSKSDIFQAEKPTLMKISLCDVVMATDGLSARCID